jgi:ABC-2 type transport system ATP-binding protein
MLVIMNLPGLTFGDRLAGAVARTAEFIVQRGKTLVIGTMEHALIDKACSHTAFIADGRILYQGTADELRQTYDNVVFVIDDPDIAGIKQALSPALGGCALAERGGSLLVRAAGKTVTPSRVYQALLEAGITPRCVRANKKNVSNAYEELTLRHDLSEQLF